MAYANNYVANASTLTTETSTNPYWDDYKASKQFYKLLFRPDRAVQARELTQIQTQIQKQIDRFGKHVFQEGSIVLPGNFTLYSEVGRNAIPYVKVRDYDNTNTAINIESFVGQQVRGQDYNIIGTITDVLDGSEDSANTKTIYVRYDSASNTNTSIKTFQSGELLSCNVGTLIVHNTSPTGTASKFLIGEGVFFAKEHFISFDTQRIILDRYNPNPTCKVGFFITESIVTSDDDQSLLDPARGASNYDAPGADRLKLDPVLQVLDFDDNVGPPDFVTLFTIKNGVIETYNERTQYAIIQDELAKRTYDESGNYYVNGLNVQVREHLNDGSNFGRYTEEQGGNSQLLFVGVEPGTAYVNGYEINLLDTRELDTPKANTYSNVNSQIAGTIMGSWIRVEELVGTWKLDQGQEITLYDTAQNKITNKSWSVGAPSGNAIGTAKLINMEYISGTHSYDAKYDIYLSDIKMYGSNSFSDVKSLYADSDPNPDLFADIVLTSNVAVLNDATQPLLYYVGSDFVRKIRSISDDSISDTTFLFNRTEGAPSGVTIANNGTFSVSISAGVEAFPYGTVSDISQVQKKEIQVVVDTSFNIAIPGTVTANAGESTLIGTSTFFTRLNPGDKIEVAGKSNTFYIQSITSDTQLISTENFPAGISGNSAFKSYKVGDIIDMSGIGSDAGADRSIGATPTQLSFDIKETLPSSVSATVNLKLARSSAKEVLKTLKPNRVVHIDCSTAGTSGPFCLGFSDVYQIRKIILKTGSAPSSLDDGSDVTGQFIFNNGQKNTHYDLATITPRIALTASDHLLIQLDYFEPDFTSRYGYFSIDSYPIDDNAVSNTTIKTEDVPIFKSPTDGSEYDLRNYFDFRPVKEITATDTTTVASGSTNPGNTSSFNVSTGGLRLPVPSSEITYDYSYYLARKDIVILDNRGNFRIIRGVPATNPITPTAPENTMILAVLTITPYPSLSPAYARSIGKKNKAVSSKKVASVRYTMKDIGVLKDRIVNLEYYTTLSLLEKAALDFKVLDDFGLDRFKNGVFVDSFKDHELGATYNPDYRIVVDEKEKSIRPIFTMESFGYDLLSNTNMKQTGSVLTLDYSEEVLLKQNNVTTSRNVERTSYKYPGILTLFPDQDVWVDVGFAPDEQIDFGSTNVSQVDFIPDYEQSLGIVWEAWKKFAVGYNLYSGTDNTGQLLGSYSTYNQARAAASAYEWTNTVTIETLFNNERKGVENFLVEGTETNSTGDKVIDVSQIPYMRPQTITIMARGIKPFTKLYVFFDNDLVSDYVTPLDGDQYQALVDGVEETLPPGDMAEEGSDLIADENGIAYFNLRIDEAKKFRVGTKVITVIDNNSNDKSLSTTMAQTNFYASGLNVTKQKTVFSTHPIGYVSNGVEQSFSSTENEVINQRVLIDWAAILQSTLGGDGGGGGECSAYSFLVKAPHTEAGVYLTSFDIFIAAKSSVDGIWFEIAEMNNAGTITRNRIPKSQVWVEANDVPLSEDGKTNPLRVTFDEPLFLENNKEYALLIHTENVSPDYYLWVSKLGDTDVNTGDIITNRAFTGTFFTTNNNLDWDIVTDVDLTLILYRASFVVNTQGSSTIGNKPVEKFRMSSVSNPLSQRVGDVFHTGDHLTLSGANGSPVIGYQATGANSGLVANVLSIVDTTYYMSNTGFETGETVNFAYSNGTYAGITATVGTVSSSRGRLVRTKETSNVYSVYLQQSSGGFAANDVIYSQNDPSYYGTIESVEDYRYSVVDFEPAALEPFKTELGYEMKTYDTDDIAGSFSPINAEEVISLFDEKNLMSRTNELLDISGNRSNQIKVKMRTSSEYVSPVFNMDRSHTIFVDNLINSNTSGETASSGGQLYNKYISKTVTLAEGQDAEDMLVILTSHRPPGTDVKVWIKALNGEDSDTFNDRSWLELEKSDDGDVLYSSIGNKNDFKEFKYVIPSENMANGVFQYTNSTGITFSGYKYFAVKIGLTSDDSSIVPRVADLRVIALQS